MVVPPGTVVGFGWVFLLYRYSIGAHFVAGTRPISFTCIAPWGNRCDGKTLPTAAINSLAGIINTASNDAPRRLHCPQFIDDSERRQSALATINGGGIDRDRSRQRRAQWRSRQPAHSCGRNR